MVGRVIWALHRGFRDEWARHPPEAKGRGRIGGAVTAVVMLAMGILLLVAPWGERRTLLYVFGTLGIVMAVCMVLILIGGIRESRAANARRRARSSGR